LKGLLGSDAEVSIENVCHGTDEDLLPAPIFVVNGFPVRLGVSNDDIKGAMHESGFQSEL
jgi:hypothetical protein